MHDDKLKHAIFAFHAPKIADKTYLINVLSSGYVNFVQVYDILNGSILGLKLLTMGSALVTMLTQTFLQWGQLELSLPTCEC